MSKGRILSGISVLDTRWRDTIKAHVSSFLGSTPTSNISGRDENLNNNNNSNSSNTDAQSHEQLSPSSVNEQREVLSTMESLMASMSSGDWTKILPDDFYSLIDSLQDLKGLDRHEVSNSHLLFNLLVLFCVQHWETGG